MAKQLVSKETTMEENLKCESCGVHVERTTEPVTVGGWYGDVRYEWDAGQLKTVEVRCLDCLVRRRRVVTPFVPA